MADLRLNILGDGASATVALNKVQAGLVALAKGLVDFAGESVKAFEEQEQADRRLALVAGETTEAFKRQAAALQASTGVSDDAVQKMQAMLLTYGEAPAEIDKTIRAVLDMSAATGQDAVQAISELTSRTTTGRKMFVELGLEYKNTGTRAEVLASATKALGDKFAGAAEGEAGSLAGQVKIAKGAFGELKESFGGFITELAGKTGIIEKATQVFQFLNDAINPSNAVKLGGLDEKLAGFEKEISLLESRDDLSERENNRLGDLIVKRREARQEQEKITASMKANIEAEKKLGEAKTGRADGLKAGGKADKGDADDDAKKELERAIKAQEVAEKLFESSAQKARDRADERVKSLHAAKEKEARALDAEEKKAETERKRVLDKEKQDLEERQRQYEHAGAAIGMAFASALSNALSQLAEGGEIDAVSMTADILSAVVSVAVSLIPGFGAFAGIAGSLAGTGVRAIGAAAGGGTKKRRHNGGWAGDGMARYHLGTWVGSDEEPAILQTGERVLARNEVAAMGGKRGVEAAVKGRGGGSVVNIQTFDAGSFREIFSGRGKQGLIDANRTGHGVASFFGGR